MKFIKNILFIFFALMGLNVFAQPDKAPKQTIDGKEYYIHTVESGTTLYGLSKMYKVTIEEISTANPGKTAVLSIGDKIKIPVTNTNNTTNNTNSSTTVNSNTGTEMLQGDPNYETHTVLKGETVSAIARKYTVSIADIYNLNPGSETSIKEGQILKIKKKITETTTTTNQTNTSATTNSTVTMVEYKHVVSGGETMYNLTKKFRISEDSIKLLNNGLPKGLRTGDTLKLMISQSLAEKYKNTQNAATNNSNNLSAGNEIKPAITGGDKKEIYNVGLLLPFFLDKNQAVLENASSSSEKLTYLYEPTRQSLDFYEGVKFALDSLKGAGLSVNLRVYDTWNDTARISSITKTEEFAKLDLIIGPTDHVEIVSKAAKNYNIPLVCPFSYTNKILFNNPYVSKATTSLSVIIDETSDYVVKNYSDVKIFVLDGKDKKDDAAVESYKKTLNKKLKEKGLSADSVMYIKMESASTKNIVNHISKGKTNVFIIPSNDIVFISSFLSNLNNLTNQWNGKDYSFTIFGTDEWVKMEDLDINYKVKFNVHVPSPSLVDFDDSTTKIQFIKGFRNKYKSDPDRFAMMGFDITYFFMAGYLENGKNFINYIENYDIPMISTRFKFKQVAEGSGFLNTNVYILEYEDYKLIRRN